MENFIFCINVTLPIFLLMIFGYVLRKIRFLDEQNVKMLNGFVFKIALPALVFEDLAREDFGAVWNTRFFLYCFIVTVISIVLAFVASYLFGDYTLRGEFIQASFRSSAALLGIGFISNIYGNSGMGPLMIISSVPLYNIVAVIVLSLFKPEHGRIDMQLIKKTLRGIVTNPIILGIVIGLIWSLLRIPQPVIMTRSIHYVASLATPLGLMALGASIDLNKAFAKLTPSICATLMKLVLLCAIFLPIAIRMGFRESELIAILVMLGSPTTVSCFIMAKSMGHEGILSSSVIVLTTFFSAFTLTAWLYVLKSMGLI